MVSVIKKSVKSLSFCLLIFAFSLSVSADNDASQVGRYQIVFSPHARVDSYLIDTVTGTTWEQLKYTDLREEPTMWVAIDRIDLGIIHESISTVIDKYGYKADKKVDKGPDEWKRVEKDDNKK